ncbi:murein transglycosylase, partial [Rhizobiaceae sp. 2RAB30]
MASLAKVKVLAVATAMLGLAVGTAEAAKCGNNSAGFEAWKAAFTQEAAANGIGKKALGALA